MRKGDVKKFIMSNEFVPKINAEAKGDKLGKVEGRRNGDAIEFVEQIGTNIRMRIVEVLEMIRKFEEEFVLEKMTNEEFTRFKKVVDSEWMRRKYNGNK
jgi:hypothetical protein